MYFNCFYENNRPYNYCAFKKKKFVFSVNINWELFLLQNWFMTFWVVSVHLEIIWKGFKKTIKNFQVVAVLI